jgi:hypothetical protein
MRAIAPRTGALELTLAEEQAEYAPLTIAVYLNYEGGEVVAKTYLSRWTFSPEERELIARGADIYLGELLPIQHAFTPLIVSVGCPGWAKADGSAPGSS